MADEIVAPEFVWHAPGLPETPLGPEGVKPVATAYRAALGNLELVDEDIVTQGDITAYRFILRGIHQAELLGRPVTALRAWQIESLHEPLAGTTAGLWRVTGTALAGATALPWSVILEGIQPGRASDAAAADPGGAHYWRREALLYQSGILEGLAGLRAPRLLGVAEQAAAIWLWLEDVATPGGSRWSAPRYFRAARDLVVFNGAYLVGRPLPGEPSSAGTGYGPPRRASQRGWRNWPRCETSP